MVPTINELSQRITNIIRYMSWNYLLLVLMLWLMIFTVGDHWWPATVILFAPRWFAALPLVILLPLAGWRHQFSLIPLLLGALVVFGPYMGLNLPYGKADPTNGKMLRILTCNIDNGNCDTKGLAAIIRDTAADVVALQEFTEDVKLSLPPGWRVIQERGLAVLSRFPLQRGRTTLVFKPPNRWPSTCLLHCIVKTPGGDLNFCSVQLPTPRFGLLSLLDRHTILRPSRNGQLLADTAYRRRASQEVQKTVALLSGQTIVAGDLNMPVDSTIYRQFWSDYTNAFSVAGIGYGWTQRAVAKKLPFPIGIRIDHILASSDLSIRTCEVGPDVGSDHLPLIADIELKTVAK